MGRVYQCTDTGLGRQVAVKTLQPHLLDDAVMRERFVREARALARVKSSHVVTVHAIGEDAALGPYVVMERLVGEDLLSRLGHGPLELDDLLAVARGVALGLKDAHAAGLLHRDIKPANLFLRGGRCSDVVITDFGLAKDWGQLPSGPGATDAVPASQLTSADVVVGTPAYLAPECARGRPASPASDLYALGATLFHLWTGQPPFAGDVPIEVLTRAVLEPAPRASTLRPETPAVVDDLLQALLEKTPEQRPDGAAAVLVRLDAIATPPATDAAPSPTPAPTPGTTTTSGSTGTMVLGSLGPDVPGPPAPTATAAPPAMAAGAFSAPTTTSDAGGPLVSSPKAAAVRTATYTVMMTDIAGYTERTSRQSRDEAARWLALHDSLLQPIFRAFSGKVIKTIGDAFLVVFSSPTDAVHCGMAIQDRLFLHNRSAPTSDRIQVRVALSAGEVRLRGLLGVGGDIFGEPVNLAARLEGLAEAGEVLLTDAVFATMNQAEVKTAPRGSHRFKGISREVAVYAVVPTGADGQAPFGEVTLARVTTTAMDAVAPAMRGGLARVQGALAAMPEPLLRRGAMAAAAVVVVGALALALLSPGRRDRIEGGEAAAVIAEIEAIPEDQRSAEDLVDLGLALIASERRREGLTAFKAAVVKGSRDADIVDGVFAAFAFRDAGDGVELLAAWPEDIDDRLRDSLGGGWWLRHHALNALEKRGKATDDDRMKVGLLDVEQGSECGARKVGVGLLRKAGRGEAALSAVQTLSANMASNLCMALDLKPAEDAIRRRTKEK